jgi:hypothetical protein
VEPSLLHQLLGTDRLDDGVGAQPAGQLLDLRHAVLAAFGDDVSRAQLKGELLLAARNDPLRAELFGGQDRQEADRAVADDRDCLARAGLGGGCAEPAGPQPAGDQIGIGRA